MNNCSIFSTFRMSNWNCDRMSITPEVMKIKYQPVQVKHLLLRQSNKLGRDDVTRQQENKVDLTS